MATPPPAPRQAPQPAPHTAPCPAEPGATPVAGADRPPARITSDQLFRGAQELLIDHAGGTYRLRQTSLGKLILTK